MAFRRSCAYVCLFMHRPDPAYATVLLPQVPAGLLFPRHAYTERRLQNYFDIVRSWKQTRDHDLEADFTIRQVTKVIPERCSLGHQRKR